MTPHELASALRMAADAVLEGQTSVARYYERRAHRVLFPEESQPQTIKPDPLWKPRVVRGGR